MGHENEIKINIASGVSFGWIEKELVKKLDGHSLSRIAFIKKCAHDQFGIELIESVSLPEFDALVSKNGYSSRIEWLREHIRREFELDVEVDESFGEMIRAYAESHFGIELSGLDSIVKLEEKLKENHYLNTSEWIREVLRKTAQQEVEG